MLRVNVARSNGPGAVNEDVVGHCVNAAWVIDEATGVGAALFEAPSDATWLATTADRELRRILSDLPTREVVRAAIGGCRDAFGRKARTLRSEPHERPSAALALVRLVGNLVEFATLGDCRVAHVGVTRVANLFGTTPLAAIKGRTVAAVERLMASRPHIGLKAMKEAILPKLLENRRLMNRPGGHGCSAWSLRRPIISTWLRL